jgi:hypothetical protein
MIARYVRIRIHSNPISERRTRTSNVLKERKGNWRENRWIRNDESRGEENLARNSDLHSDGKNAENLHKCWLGTKTSSIVCELRTIDRETSNDEGIPYLSRFELNICARKKILKWWFDYHLWYFEFEYRVRFSMRSHIAVYRSNCRFSKIEGKIITASMSLAGFTSLSSDRCSCTGALLHKTMVFIHRRARIMISIAATGQNDLTRIRGEIHADIWPWEYNAVLQRFQPVWDTRSDHRFSIRWQDWFCGRISGISDTSDCTECWMSINESLGKTSRFLGLETRTIILADHIHRRPKSSKNRVEDHPA